MSSTAPVNADAGLPAVTTGGGNGTPWRTSTATEPTATGPSGMAGGHWNAARSSRALPRHQRPLGIASKIHLGGRRRVHAGLPVGVGETGMPLAIQLIGAAGESTIRARRTA